MRTAKEMSEIKRENDYTPFSVQYILDRIQLEARLGCTCMFWYGELTNEVRKQLLDLGFYIGLTIPKEENIEVGLSFQECVCISW